MLVENPIASTVEEGHAIIAAARRAGVTLMVGHVERFNPAVAAIKNAIKVGKRLHSSGVNEKIVESIKKSIHLEEQQG